MKRCVKRMLAVMMAMVLVTGSLCGVVTAQEDGAYIEILGGVDSTTLELAQSIDMWDYMIYPDEAWESVTWTTGDETILRIDEEGGLITAIAQGETTLTASTATGLSDTVIVTVKQPAAWNECGTTPIIVKGYGMTQTFSFVPTVTDMYTLHSEGAGDPYVEVYDSDMNMIGGADDENDYHFVLQTSLTAGEMYYFVIGAYGSAIMDVTLKQGVDTAFTTFAFKQDSIELAAGDVYVPQFDYEPVTMPFGGCEIVSNDESIVIIQDYALVAQGIGTTTVTATAEDGSTATITVTVKEPTVLLPGDVVNVDLSDGVAMRTYAIVVQESGLYTFQSFDEVMAGVILLDVYGNVYEDIGVSGKGFVMQERLMSDNVYVLCVMSYENGANNSLEMGMIIGDLTLNPTGVSLAFPHLIGKQQGDELWVPYGAYLYCETVFEGGYGTKSEECTVVSGDETVLALEFAESDFGELYCAEVGTTTLTVTSESGLTHTYTIHVIEQANGDITWDGAVDIADAVLLFRYVNGRMEASLDEVVMFDINNDNRIDIADAVLMFRYVNGRVTSFA